MKEKVVMDRIDRIEESIEYAKVRIERCDQVLRLSENPDFQAIVAKGYFEKEAIRLVGLYGSGNLSAEQLIEVQKDMHGVGSFRRFLAQIVQEGQQARSDLQSNQETLQEELAMRAQMKAAGEEAPVPFDADYAGSLGA